MIMYKGLIKSLLVNSEHKRDHCWINDNTFVDLVISPMVIQHVCKMPGQNAYVLTFALHNFHVIKGQNMPGQITSNRKSTAVWSDGLLCIPFIFIKSLNQIQCMLKNVQCMASQKPGDQGCKLLWPPALLLLIFTWANFQVLPRQTCGLYTHTLHLKDYPRGEKRLRDSIHGGELFQVVINNQVSIIEISH